MGKLEHGKQINNKYVIFRDIGYDWLAIENKAC
jgi:hypothetical protein